MFYNASEMISHFLFEFNNINGYAYDFGVTRTVASTNDNDNNVVISRQAERSNKTNKKWLYGQLEVLVGWNSFKYIVIVTISYWKKANTIYSRKWIYLGRGIS